MDVLRVWAWEEMARRVRAERLVRAMVAADDDGVVGRRRDLGRVVFRDGACDVPVMIIFTFLREILLMVMGDQSFSFVSISHY